jgi:hypothetical protein
MGFIAEAVSTREEVATFVRQVEAWAWGIRNGL